MDMAQTLIFSTLSGKVGYSDSSAAVHHDYERISKAPNPTAGAEVMVQYTRAASVAKKLLAGCIKKVGRQNL